MLVSKNRKREKPQKFGVDHEKWVVFSHLEGFIGAKRQSHAKHEALMGKLDEKRGKQLKCDKITKFKNLNNIN